MPTRSTLPTETSRLSRRTFLLRAGALTAGALAFATSRPIRTASASAFTDCDMTVGRDSRPHKGFASVREGSGGQCTTHAARRFDTVAPDPGVNWTGGARLWLDRAAAAGWMTTTDIEAARPGSIAVWDNWDGVSEQRLFNGHVAFVEDCAGSTIYLSEMNWGNLCYGQPRWRTSMWGRVAYPQFDLTALAQRGPHRFIGYIYPVRDEGIG